MVYAMHAKVAQDLYSSYSDLVPSVFTTTNTNLAFILIASYGQDVKTSAESHFTHTFQQNQNIIDFFIMALFYISDIIF